MTDKKKTPTGDNKPNIDLREIKLTAAGDPLPIDPDTGKIDVDKLTDAQRAEFEAAAKQIAAASAAIAKKMQPAVNALNAIIEQNRKLTESIKKAAGVFQSDKMRELLESIRTDLLPMQELFDEIDALEPYIKAELQKGEYEIKTFDDLMQYTPGELLELRNDPTSDIYKLFEAAAAARAVALPVISTSRTDKLNTPGDRFNFLAWNDFEATDGQIRFNMMAAADKRNPERQQRNISMLYSLSFADDPNIKTTKELNHYDRRLMQAIDTLFTTDPDDQHIYLIGDVFRAMGGTSKKLSDTQRDNINNSLTKQGTARVYMNNKTEATEYNYPEIYYDGNILDFERITATYNGQEATAIKVNRRPAMMEFADKRKQMTAVPLRVLQSGISQTNNHLRIEDYLLYRITRQKNAIAKLQQEQQKKYTQTRQKKIREESELTILLDTFHEYAGTAGKHKNTRNRAEETAGRYLEHYESCGYIAAFEIKADRIIITLPIK